MEIAELEVKIISDAQKAAAALDTLADSAKTLQKSITIDTSSIAGLKDIKDLAQIDGKKLEAIGEGMSKLSEGFAQFRNVKMADVTRAGKAITSLNEVKADKIAEIGAAIQPLAKSLAELSGVQFDSRNVTNFLNALGRLSGTDTAALQNLDFSAVGRSIRQLTQELADAPKINQSVISMTSAVANLAKSGSNIPIVTQSLGSLGTGLKDFMNVMSSAPKISTNTIQFTQALGTLANAGAKAETTAKHLGTLAQELRSFMQVMSTAPRISANTVQMTTALANLANAGSRVGRSSTTLINGLSNTSKSMNKAATSAKGLARAFGKFYANWFLVIRGIKGIWKSIESSMDYIEVLNYFNAAFGQVAESAVDQWEKAGYDSAESYYNSFSQRAQQLTTKMTGFTISDSGMLEATGGKSLGINPKDLMNYQAMFAQMSNSMGVTAETSLKLSTALTEIGADLASVRNMKFDKVWTDMASGLAGMSRTLDKYGANIRNVNLQQKLNEIGIKASITALNQNEKALLRTIILLDSTRYAWGDLAETINSPANQLRLLEANFNNLARTIGNIFLPIVAKVLPYINALVSALQRLAQFIVKLLGFEGFDWGGASGTGGGFDELIGGAEDLEEGLDGASGAAKKLNKQIRAFDELNVITMPEETTGAGGGLGGGIDTGLLEGALDDILDEYQTAWDKAFDEMEERANQFADNVAKAFQTGGLFGVGRYLSESLTGALNSIPWESIYEGARTFGTGLAEFLNGLITPDLFAAVGQTIAGALNTAIYSALSFAENFDWNNFGASLAAGVNKFFETFGFIALADGLNAWANGLLDALIRFLDDVKWEMIGTKIGEFLVEIEWLKIAAKVAKALWKALNAAIKTWSSMFKTAPIETALLSLMAFPKLLKAITNSKIGKGLANLAKKLSTFAKNAKLAFSALTGNEAALTTLTTNFPKLGKAVSVLSDSFLLLKMGIADGEFFNGLNAAIENIRNNLTGLQKGVITAVAGFAEFEIVSNVFEGLVEGNENLLAGIAKIGAAAAAASAAMYVALGPAGIAIGAITGVVAAVKGINDAIDDIRAENIGNAINNALTKPGGVGIDELFKNFTDKIGGIGDSFSAISEKSENLNNAKENVEGVVSEIEKIRISLETGVTTAEEKIPVLIDLYGQLGTAIEEKIGAAGDVLLTVFAEGGISAQAFESAGVNAENMRERVVKSMDEQQKAAYDLKMELIELQETDPTNPRIPELEAQFIQLSYGITETDKAAEILKTATDVGIDWKKYLDEDGLDVASFSQALGEIKNVVINTRETAEEEFTAAVTAAKALGDEENYELVRSALPGALGYVNDVTAEEAQQLVNTLQNDVIGELESIIEEAQTNWDEMSPIEHILNGSDEEEYIKEYVESFKTNTVDPLTSEIESFMNDLGVEGAGYASAATEAIIGALFDEEQVNYGANIPLYTTTLNGSWREIIEGATEGISELAASKGKDATDGYANGFSDTANIQNAQNKAKTFTEEVLDVIAETQKSNSPSKVTEGLGKDATDGYANGFSNPTNIANAQNEARLFTENVLNTIEETQNTRLIDIGKQAAENFKTGFSENLATVTDAIQEWVDSISETFTKDVFSEAFDNLVEGLKAKWNEFASWWSDEAMPQWKDENTSTWFSYETWFDMLEPPRTSFVDTLEEIQETWNDTSESWFDTDLTNFYSEAKWLGLLRPVISAFESSFNTVKSSVSSRMNDVYSNVRSVVSNITSAIREIESACSSATSAINNLNSAASSISNISINASVSGYNIPAFAKGGVVTGATIAEVGEKGQEAILPLTSQTAIQKIVNAMAVPLSENLKISSLGINSYAVAAPPKIPYQNYENIRSQAQTHTYAYDYGSEYRQSIYESTNTNKLLSKLIDLVEKGHTIEIDGQPIANVVKKKFDEEYRRTGRPAIEI